MSKTHKQLYTPQKVEPPPANWGWGKHFIPAVRSIRGLHATGLRETLDMMAQEFGFVTWPEWQPWIRGRNIDFSSVRGPYAFVILKAIARKHGRHKLGTPEIEQEDQNED